MKFVLLTFRNKFHVSYIQSSIKCIRKRDSVIVFRIENPTKLHNNGFIDDATEFWWSYIPFALLRLLAMHIHSALRRSLNSIFFFSIFLICFLRNRGRKNVTEMHVGGGGLCVEVVRCRCFCFNLFSLQ